jgi:hypothetical protein
MDKPSVKLFLQSQDATVKYDYFVCTVAGALFAYIGQSYSPHKLNNFSAFAEPLTLLLLTISFWQGAERIKKQIYIVQRNQKMLERKEAAEDIARKLEAEEGNITSNPKMTLLMDGQEITPQQLFNLQNVQLEEAKKIGSELATHIKCSNKLASRRDQLLLAGFCALLIAKIIQPYQSISAPPSASISATVNIPAQSIPSSLNLPTTIAPSHTTTTKPPPVQSSNSPPPPVVIKP